MDHEWIVEVKDDADFPVTNATVAFVEFNSSTLGDWPFRGVTATHSHKGDGVYEASPPIVPTEKTWILVVLVAGRSPVTQLVTLKANDKGEISTTPTPLKPGSPKLARTIKFVSEVKKVGTATVRRTRFSVTTFPVAEFVFVSGIDFESTGTKFRIFAETYRSGLFKEGQLDHGVIVTLFSADDRSRERHVPAVGGGWMLVDFFSFGPTAGITPGQMRLPVSGDISVVDVYKYLDLVGRTEPGRVKEVGFFSHSFSGGPLMFNTFDHASTNARDPTDFDARRKDFQSPNLGSWPAVAKAMDSTGNWHVWGCSATTHVRHQTAKAWEHRNGPEDAFFTVTSNIAGEDVEERTTYARVRNTMEQAFGQSGYMGTAADALKVSVFGAPPGVGSNFHPTKGIMYVNEAAPENASSFAFFKREFSPQFAPTHDTYDSGYVDYAKLANRPPRPAPPFSSEFYFFHKDHGNPNDPTDTPETTIRFDGHRGRTRPGIEFDLKVTAKTSFATPGMTGHLYELRHRTDPTKSFALYVQEDQKIFEVTRDSGNNFTVVGGVLSSHFL